MGRTTLTLTYFPNILDRSCASQNSIILEDETKRRIKPDKELGQINLSIKHK